VPALAVAVETNPAVGGLLEHALIAAGPGETVLRRIAADLPYPTIALAGTAAIVHTRLAVLASGDPSRRASHLTSLSNSLGDIGEREKALAAIEEAVALYRELAAARPDAFRPALASSLHTLSLALSHFRRREEAVAVNRELVPQQATFARVQ